METCPKCGAALEENVLDIDLMSEGQHADYMAGFVEKKCPSCGLEIEDEEGGRE